MSVNTLSTVEPEQARDLIRASALALNQPERIEELAAAHGVEPGVIAAMLTDPQALAEVLKELGRMRRCGELLAELAHPPLEKFMRRAEAAMDDPELPMTTASKVADTVFKLAGLSEERTARAKVATPDNCISLHVLKPGDPEPPAAKPGELQLTIRFSGPDNTERVIEGDAEVVDEP